MEDPVSVAYLRWIVAAPLLGALVNGLAGARLQRRWGPLPVALVGCVSATLSFGVVLFAWWDLAASEPTRRGLLDTLGTWFSVGPFRVEVGLSFDPLSAVMAALVTGIGVLVHGYSAAFLAAEPTLWRYYAWLNLFTATMLVLVFADNLPVLFLGWEGAALCSYGLIGFWHRDPHAAAAGTKAFVVNRLGDVGLLLGICVLFAAMSGAGHPSLAFRDLALHRDTITAAQVFGWGATEVTAICLFIGAAAKSAQAPLHVWLPNAMAGPTPVSAYLHAATMVTAGVYLLARMNFLFVAAPGSLALIAWVGALTSLLGAVVAACQNDIKKVLSYATISQLGLMMLAVGVGAPGAAIFHLMTHAFAKSCLFLGAGSVLWALSDERDIQRMGGLRRWMPGTHVTFAVAALASAGLPPLSGFFSKDEILWRTLVSGIGGPVLWAIALATAGLTSFYLFRMLFLVFHGDNRSEPLARERLRRPPRAMLVPAAALAVLAAVAGIAGAPHEIGGMAWIERWLAPVWALDLAAADPRRGVRSIVMLLSVAMAVGGAAIAYAMYVSRSFPAGQLLGRWGAFGVRWARAGFFLEHAFERGIAANAARAGRLVARFDAGGTRAADGALAHAQRVLADACSAFDHRVVDRLTVGIGTGLLVAGSGLRRLQTGSISVYLYIAVVAVVVAIALHLV